MNRYKYFVFGTDAVRMLSEGDEEGFLKTKDECDYGFYEWDEQNSYPEDLLDAMNGWFEYYMVDKEFFDKIKRDEK